jgi:perosamine synthetase
MIPLFTPELTEEMKEAATHALQNEFYVMGESVKKFEEEFASFCGTKHAIAVSSGTAALRLSLLALGVKPGDTVSTTPNSFVATANSIFHIGAKPFFTDIEKNTGNIDPDLVKINGCKGIIPVHLYGNPARLGEIMDVVGEGFVLEDACQAHGALYNDRHVGSIGDAGCFSFYSAKNMTVCGDGGMVVTNNSEIAEKVATLRDCGRKSKYEHTMIGYTNRLNTINAAIGRVQLRHLDEWNEKRRGVAKIYRNALPEAMLLQETKDSVPVYHLFVIKSEKRDALQDHLKQNEIGTGIHYPLPIHLQPVYKELFGFKGQEFPIAEEFAKHVLSIPIFPGLEKDKAKFICEKIMEFS